MADVRRRPAPVTDIWNWQMRAACQGLDTSMFFHPERERGPTRVQRERRAKQVCFGCPVRAQCRAHALSVREPYGVWGGLTESERLGIIRADTATRTAPPTADGAA
jgi:WhiB family redox-sensing transcriptional regulator